jgi:CDP-paratose 2-epimerase
LELIEILEKKLKIKAKIEYQKEARVGDHICYITDSTKFEKFYPNWQISKNLNEIIDEIISSEKK